MIASHLLKFVHYLENSQGYKANLNYLRNVNKKEVDFIVSIGSKPWFAVEVKLSDTQPSKNLFYYKERLKIPFVYQVILKPDIDIMKEEVRIISAGKFLTALI